MASQFDLQSLRHQALHLATESRLRLTLSVTFLTWMIEITPSAPWPYEMTVAQQIRSGVVWKTPSGLSALASPRPTSIYVMWSPDLTSRVLFHGDCNDSKSNEVSIENWECVLPKIKLAPKTYVCSSSSRKHLVSENYSLYFLVYWIFSILKIENTMSASHRENGSFW